MNTIETLAWSLEQDALRDNVVPKPNNTDWYALAKSIIVEHKIEEGKWERTQRDDYEE